MPKQFGSNPFIKGVSRRMAGAMGVFFVCMGVGPAGATSNTPLAAEFAKKPEGLEWQQVFSSVDAAHFLEFTAHFRDAKGGEHLLHYWREGNQRLRRNTDGNMDLMVERLADGEHRYHLINHRKKILTQIDQTNLHRIGQFSTWDDFAHTLAMPASDVVLVKSTNAEALVSNQRCSWYEVSHTMPGDLTGMHQRICWSRSLGIPLKIIVVGAGGDEVTTWLVDNASTRKLDNAAFTANIIGYAVVDANVEISPESD